MYSQTRTDPVCQKGIVEKNQAGHTHKSRQNENARIEGVTAEITKDRIAMKVRYTDAYKHRSRKYMKEFYKILFLLNICLAFLLDYLLMTYIYVSFFPVIVYSEKNRRDVAPFLNDIRRKSQMKHI